jgi:DNA-binding beta-propeller fold protein YncE
MLRFISLAAITLLVSGIMSFGVRASGAPAPGVLGTVAGGGTGGQLSDDIEAFDLNDASEQFVLTTSCDINKVTSGLPTRLAGTSFCDDSIEGSTAAETPIFPSDIAVGPSGHIFFVERGWNSTSCFVRKIDNGIVVNVAGNGSCVAPTDGGDVMAGGLDIPDSIAIDGAGQIFLSSYTSCRVWKISGGVITHLGGTGACGYTLGPDATTTYMSPQEIAVDASGSNVYIAENGFNRCRVRKISAGVISLVAGTGTCTSTGDGGAAVDASVFPLDVDVAANGDVFFGGSCAVRKVSAGVISTVAACNSSWGVTYLDGLRPRHIGVHGTSEVWMGEDSGCRITRLSGGSIHIMAGGTCATFAGDGGDAADAKLYEPYAVAVDQAGFLYITDRGNCRVRKVDLAGIITTIAGGGNCGAFVEPPPPGVAVPALGTPVLAHNITIDGDGNPVVLESPCRARRIEGGMITTIIGNNECGTTMTDGAPATSASIQIRQIAARGIDLYVTDYCKVWRITAGIAYHIAGTANCSGDLLDGVPATSSSLNDPQAIAVDGAGTVYVSVNSVVSECRVRKISQGVITTVAGGSVCAHGGDGGPATAATLGRVISLAVDSAGSLYIVDGDNCRVRKVMDGVINTIAGTGTCGFSPDGTAAALAQIDAAVYGPAGISIDAAHNVYLANQYGRVRVIGGTLDTDGDGCTDRHEMGSNKLLGGQRDPWNAWDFYDVNGTKKIDAADIGLVRLNFNGAGPTPPEDTAYDRSSGVAPWAPGPPDNKINAVDIARVRAAFNHNCQGPPT